MVLINKEEKEAICKQIKDIGIVRTVRQKSNRHRYYMEERRDAMILLKKLRGEWEERPKKYSKTNNQRNGKSFNKRPKNMGAPKNEKIG